MQVCIVLSFYLHLIFMLRATFRYVVVCFVLNILLISQVGQTHASLGRNSEAGSK